MSYVNILHTPVTSSKHSDFSSLGGAVLPSHSAFMSPSRRRLPQPPIPASKWRHATRSSALHKPISFDFIGYSGQGVMMTELVSRSGGALAQMIQGAGDMVLAHTGMTRITFCIIWPGYEHVEWVRLIEVTTRSGPITRAQLGALISQQFGKYIQTSQSAPSTSSGFQIGGHSGIGFEHMVLVALCNTFEDCWQADVTVDRR